MIDPGLNIKGLRPVYKPHSVHGACAPLCDHLSGRRVTAPLNATYPGLTVSPCETALMKTSSLPPSADGFVPTWSCSRRGLPGHLHYCKCRWSFTPPFHHHLVPLRVTGLSVSVALIRQVNSSRRCSPPRVLSDAVLYGVRTFLDPAKRNRDRPTDLRHFHHTLNSIQ